MRRTRRACSGEQQWTAYARRSWWVSCKLLDAEYGLTLSIYWLGAAVGQLLPPTFAVGDPWAHPLRS